MIGLDHYLAVSGLLFALGLFGVIIRRNLLIIYMSLELMLNAVILSVIFVAWAGWSPAQSELLTTWLSVGDLHADFGLRLDPLSLAMMLIVTGVASVIHIYSWGYMRDDPGFSRFFACLSLFTF